MVDLSLMPWESLFIDAQVVFEIREMRNMSPGSEKSVETTLPTVKRTWWFCRLMQSSKGTWRGSGADI